MLDIVLNRTLQLTKLALMLVLLVCVTALAVGAVGDMVLAQEVTEPVAQIPTTDLPSWLVPFLPYIVLLNAIMSIFSRISDRTKTDIDNKAIGWWSKIVNFLGGHWGMLNGNPRQPSPTILKS